MAVNTNDPRPPYVQIADDLRQAIKRGDIAAGEKLQSGRDLAIAYNVAPMTIHQAIRVLREEGAVESFQGRGVYVRSDNADKAGPIVSTDLATAVEDLQHEVAALTTRVDSTSDGVAVAQLRDEVADLRKQLGVLQTQLIDLYSRVGQPYPREKKPAAAPARRVSGDR
jgi:DNA-binding GntR family transcriptional regulator